MPWVGPVTMLMVSGSSSASEAKSEIGSVVLTLVVPLSLDASGGELAATVMLNVAVFESSNPSFAFQVKLSAPAYEGVGV